MRFFLLVLLPIILSSVLGLILEAVSSDKYLTNLGWLVFTVCAGLFIAVAPALESEQGRNPRRRDQ